MKITKTLYVANRDDWRDWLIKNHKSEQEVWLVYYKKHTGKIRIPYDDAVEEALCFGWIDSTVKRIDDEKYAQKFSPRKGRSKWSDLNIGRARKMIREGKMTEAGLKIFEERMEYDDAFLGAADLEIPTDLKKALESNTLALKNFNDFAPSYRKMYIHWVMSAKREDTRQKRIGQIIERSEKNKKPGMM